MKKILGIFYVLIILVVTLQYTPVSAETVGGQGVNLKEQWSLPFNSYSEIDYVGTGPSGLMYFSIPVWSKPPRNAKGQYLRQTIVAVNPDKRAIQWKYPVYGGALIDQKFYIDKDGNLHGVIDTGLKQFSRDMDVYSISPEGKLNWRITLANYLVISGKVNDKLLVYDDVSNVYAIDSKGKLAWKRELSTTKDLANSSIKRVQGNEYVLLKSNAKAESLSLDFLDWNMNKIMSFPTNKNWNVIQVEKLNSELNIAKIVVSQSSVLLVAFDNKGKQKWTKAIDSSIDTAYTQPVHVLDGNLVFTTDSGFYAINSSGKVLNHLVLSPMKNIGYKLRVDDKYISISSDYGSNGLTVVDRVSYKTVFTLPNPIKFEETQTDYYYDDAFFANNKLYMVSDSKLIQYNLN
ncbi:PQQ-binding-like beta-propeller repeat protein [Paenibacillus sp. sgz500958]|uniref:outer membrane protein assembly factor BamB family protein n=1 Tax=Paenibacillus sp. sgz500958 TaxID=3242475 RepID=UPI0036D38499